ncbi:MAG: hypothetical protein RL291_1076 [Pseudomonadota bacterium]
MLASAGGAMAHGGRDCHKGVSSAAVVIDDPAVSDQAGSTKQAVTVEASDVLDPSSLGAPQAATVVVLNANEAVVQSFDRPTEVSKQPRRHPTVLNVPSSAQSKCTCLQGCGHCSSGACCGWLAVLDVYVSPILTLSSAEPKFSVAWFIGVNTDPLPRPPNASVIL